MCDSPTKGKRDGVGGGKRKGSRIAGRGRGERRKSAEQPHGQPGKEPNFPSSPVEKGESLKVLILGREGAQMSGQKDRKRGVAHAPTQGEVAIPVSRVGGDNNWTGRKVATLGN